MITVLLNLFLFIVKFVGGKISHSVAIISDAYNNLSDAIATLFSWFGLKISSLGAGENHPNGHGRFEWIITFISSISIILLGWELLQDSIESIKNPSEPVFSLFTLIVLLISIGVKVFMYLYNNKKGMKLNSPSLKAIALDSISDAVSTTVVFISLIVYSIFKINIDGYCGILVSIFIMYNGFSSITEIIHLIMGQKAPTEKIQEVKDFILKNNHFVDVYNLQVEDFGSNRYRLSAVIIANSNIDGDTLLQELADLQFEVQTKYGYQSMLSLEKELPVEDSLNQFIDEMLTKIPVPLSKLSVRVVQGRNQKIVRVAFGIGHDDFSKMKQAETELKKFTQVGNSKYILVSELRLLQPERRHGKKSQIKTHPLI